MVGDRQADLHRLVKFVPGRHDDEDVHVAVGMGPSVRVRAEKDDLLGPKALRHLAGEATDQSPGNVRPTIPPGKRRGMRVRVGGLYASIISDAA